MGPGALVAVGAVGALALGVSILGTIVFLGVKFSAHFSQQATTQEKGVYVLIATVVLVYTCVGLMGPLLAPPCETPSPEPPLKYGNLDYNFDPCLHFRYPHLLGATKWECDMFTRILLALVCGSLIGMERRRADRPVGLRTMSIVSLTACVLTIVTNYAFLDGPMSWDASRVAAAIPSGVGFLGAATIWKSSSSNDSPPEVHGLTTATSVWLSAAIGLFCGGGLFVPGVYTSVAAIVFLTHAPTRTDVTVKVTDAKGLFKDASAPLAQPSKYGAVLYVDSYHAHWICHVLAAGQAFYLAIALAEPLLAPACSLSDPHRHDRNVDFSANYDPCGYERYWQLGFLNKWDCDMVRRLSLAVILGAIVGFERRRPDRAAGIRTMSLISLGSSAFCVGGMFCEIKGPQTWDPARVAAAVVTGVGFLGGASIWKSTTTKYEIHGLTSATSVWFSAALGLTAGGAMYTVGVFSAFVAVLYLRFGPRPAHMPTEADSEAVGASHTRPSLHA